MCKRLPVLKAELIEKSPCGFSSFRRYAPQNNFESTCDKENSVTNKDSNSENKRASSSNNTQQGKAPIPKLNNPYSRPSIDKCFCCEGKSNKSNVCPSRRIVAFIEEKEDELDEDDDYAGVEFTEEKSPEKVNIVLKRILLSSKEEGYHKNLF